MKIKQEHYQQLKKAIDKVHEKYPGLKELYKDQNNLIFNIKHVKDINKRYRWDMYYLTKHIKVLPSNFTIGVLYKYLNDDHIDTALKNICGDIE